MTPFEAALLQLAGQFLASATGPFISALHDLLHPMATSNAPPIEPQVQQDTAPAAAELVKPLGS